MCFLVEAVKSCSDWLRYVNIADEMEESDWLMGLQWDILLAAQTFIFKTKLMCPVSKIEYSQFLWQKTSHDHRKIAGGDSVPRSFSQNARKSGSFKEQQQLRD